MKKGDIEELIAFKKTEIVVEQEQKSGTARESIYTKLRTKF